MGRSYPGDILKMGKKKTNNTWLWIGGALVAYLVLAPKGGGIITGGGSSAPGIGGGALTSPPGALGLDPFLPMEPQGEFIPPELPPPGEFVTVDYGEGVTQTYAKDVYNRLIGAFEARPATLERFNQLVENRFSYPTVSELIQQAPAGTYDKALADAEVASSGGTEYPSEPAPTATGRVYNVQPMDFGVKPAPAPARFQSPFLNKVTTIFSKGLL